MTAETNPNPEQTTKTRSVILPTIARILMGLAFTVFGLNGFLHFMPEPKTMPPGVGAFMAGVTAAKYYLPLLFGTQLQVGILLLLNLFVPLALVLIMPVLVNIILFHICLQPAGIFSVTILLALDLSL